MKLAYFTCVALALLCAPAFSQSGQVKSEKWQAVIKTKVGESQRCAWLGATAEAIEAECNGSKRVIKLGDVASVEFNVAPASDALSLASLNEKQSAALTDAVMALRKLNDSASFGISYAQYKAKLGETKTAIDTANLLLPDGGIKQALRATWNLHLEASVTWELLTQIRRLPLQPKDRDDYMQRHPRLKLANPAFLERDEILRACWEEAAEHLKPLVELTVR